MRIRKYSPTGVAMIGLLMIGMAAQVDSRPRQGYQPTTARGVAAGKIVRKWADFVRMVYGTAPLAWARSMEATFAQADERNLQRAVGMETYEGMMGVMLGQNVSDAKVIDRLARANAPSMQALAASSVAEDLVYTMMSPCRILDTRNTGSRISGWQAKHIQVSGQSFQFQGGNTCDAAIPADPSAVVLNVVAVGPSAVGFLSVYPYGTERSASSLNYTTGADVANELIAKTTLGQPYDVSVFSVADVDLVVDIVGFFMAPKAAEPECYVETASITTIANSGGTIPATCAMGYVATGGACGFTLTATTLHNTQQSFRTTTTSTGQKKPTGYNCGYSNQSSLNYRFDAQVSCCRIPGR